jgi:hypothetical protein
VKRLNSAQKGLYVLLDQTGPWLSFKMGWSTFRNKNSKASLFTWLVRAKKSVGNDQPGHCLCKGLTMDVASVHSHFVEACSDFQVRRMKRKVVRSSNCIDHSLTHGVGSGYKSCCRTSPDRLSPYSPNLASMPVHLGFVN